MKAVTLGGGRGGERREGKGGGEEEKGRRRREEPFFKPSQDGGQQHCPWASTPRSKAEPPSPAPASCQGAADAAYQVLRVPGLAGPPTPGPLGL